MPIRALDDWAASHTQPLPLSSLKGAVLGIDASHYIFHHLHHHSSREPLLVALGGFPFALKSNIGRELQTFKNLGITCVFVFNGLDFGLREHQTHTRAESARAFEQAWDLYDQQQADQVVDAFSNAGTPKPDSLYRFLQRILHENKVEFLVAPYSAAAQLSYLGKGPNQLVDAVYGASDILLFDVEKLITKIDMENSENSRFHWVTKQFCQDELGRLSSEQFLDFALLLGSRYLRTFPPFENAAYPGKALNIREALTSFNTAGRSALTICSQFEDDRRVQDPKYLDRYKRALMTVKHHVIMDADGKVGPMDPDHVPSDMHELIGQRLPEELYFYLSKGILGPNVPNYLTSGEVLIPLPLGVEDSDIYRRLVGDLLLPIRTQSIGLLSNSLHRFYQTKVINVRTWFNEKAERPISLKALPSVKDTIQSWKLRSEQFPESTKRLRATYSSFKFAAESLKDAEFVSKSFSSRDSPPLYLQDDILANVFWRFLQLRGYVDDKHQLTAWGTCLEQALSVLDPTWNLEEPTFIAIELLRLGILNAKDWFSHVSGGPMRGSDEERTFNMLVSRVACIGKLRHKNIGYSGPLSRQLLSFRSLISTVRATLRDLIEVVLAGLLLGGDADRDRKDWTEMSTKLPFIDDNDCGLGIAVRTYLDDLLHQTNPTSPETRAEVKAKGKEWFQHSESFAGSLDIAFRLWDAVYKGTQSTGREFNDTKLWDGANKWLAERR